MKNYILFIAALMAVSCTKRETESRSTSDGYIHVNSTIAGVEEVSKALVTQNTALTDVSFLYGESTSAYLTAFDFSGVTPILGDRAGDNLGAVTFDSKLVYDVVSKKTSYLLGYHPAGTLASNVVTWRPDGATDILVSNLWSAGTFTTPQTSGMEFNHALARVEVKCVSKTNVSQSLLESVWGKITGITIIAVPTTLTFNYKTNAVAVGGTTSDLALLRGSAYDKSAAFTDITIQATGGTTVDASALIPPMVVNEITLIVKSTLLNSTEVKVSTSPGLAAGMRHNITLSFDALSKTITATTTVAPWTSAPVTDGDITALEPVVLEYGVAPFDKVGAATFGSTTASYNHLYGSGATNGGYYNSPNLAYKNEKPYYKFEIAPFGAYDGSLNTKNWADLQGTAANRSDNICVQTHGVDWRMPRASEGELMAANVSALHSRLGVFLHYHNLGATEVNASDMYCYSSTVNTFSKTSRVLNVRCIRELPPPATILEYGAAPFYKTGDVSYGSTTNSYNGLYGEGEATNGAYRTIDTYAQERPYHKFEVAKTDAYIASSATKSWMDLQGTAADKSDNICVQTHGKGWRMPRASELILIALNRNALVESGAGFTALRGTYYVSTTEKGSTQALFMKNSDNTLFDGNKTSKTVNVRCIRELPLPPPVIIEYGKAPFSNVGSIGGSTTTSYDNWYGEGKATNGPYVESYDDVFREKPYYKFEIANFDAYETASKNKIWIDLQGTKSDKSDNICVKTHGYGWRLPRVSEMMLIAMNREALSVPRESFTPPNIINYFYTSTEWGESVWSVGFYAMSFDPVPKGDNADNVRCIREVK